MDELQYKAIFYAKELWGVDFDLPVVTNARLKRKLGRFLHWRKKHMSVRIEISSRIISHELFTDDVLVHELCHWYCYEILSKGWTDSEPDFINQIGFAGSHGSGVLDFNNNEFKFTDDTPYVPKTRIVELNNKFHNQYKLV